MKHLKNFNFFEGNRFDQRIGYQTTNQEWLDWENKTETIKEEIIELSKEFDNNLVMLEDTCKNIEKHLFNIGEISHIGLLGDYARSIENTPLFKSSKEKSDVSYNKWIKYQKAKEKELQKKYPELYGWKNFLDDESEQNKSDDQEYTKLEKSAPDWFYVIRQTKNEINRFRNWMSWVAFIKDPIVNGLPKDTKNIVSNLEMLDATLHEMPEKFSKLIKKNLPDNLLDKIKKIENLRKEYYELLEVQPVHWVK